MVDGDVVAGGIGIAGNGHRAAPGGDDGRTRVGRQVNALMVAGGAAGGGFPEAEGTGDLFVAARYQPGAAHGNVAAGAVTAGIIAVASVGVADGNRGGDGGGGNVGRHVGKPFLQLGLVVFLLLLRDLGQELLVLGLQILLLELQLLALGDQLDDQIVRLLALGIQLLLGAVQLGAGALQLGLFPGQLCLGVLHPLGGVAQLLQAAGVGGSDLLHHVQPVEQVGKAVGLEEHRPIADGPFLFHGPDAGLAVLVQLVEPGLSGVQLLLLVGDQHAVCADLLVDVDDLGVEQADLLIDHVLPGHNVGDLIGGGLVLHLKLGDLILDILAVVLQGVDLLADLAGGSGGGGTGGQDADQKGQQHDGRHHPGKDGNKTFAVFHMRSPLRVTGKPWG